MDKKFVELELMYDFDDLISKQEEILERAKNTCSQAAIYFQNDILNVLKAVKEIGFETEE